MAVPALITRRRLFVAGAGALASTAALSVPVANAIEAPKEFNERQFMWDTAYVLREHDPGYWIANVIPEMGLWTFTKVSDEVSRGIFFASLQP